MGNLDCGANPSASASIRFAEAYNPLLILGYSAAGNRLFRDGISKGNQMKDIKMTFRCPNRWSAAEAMEYDALKDDDFRMQIVDPKTCMMTKKSSDSRKVLEIESNKASLDEVVDRMIRDKYNSDVNWVRIKFTIFSLVVSSSFFAAFNITTFYTGVTVLAGTGVRTAFLMNSFKQWIYETTHPDAIIKVIEACYMYRHEENLILEEECYRMLQEICR